ncbi:MAG TPA: CPBP family glutamic-type intramembrane protease [Sandaracinaceae bacterium LLY-WYZ-13_1]|nr:CPBP family glutamic-type intramembrane protease [Sandaracinaceae bacterium LLY-WYZ-13_1]
MARRPRPTHAKIAFHVGLLAGLVPILSAPALWLAAFWNRSHEPEEDDRREEQRRWTKRLFLLAAVDTLVAVVIGVSAATGVLEASMAEATPQARIGVVLEEVDAGLRVARVVEDTPAAEAGLAAGDVIKGAGGAVVAATSDLAERLEDGVPVTLTLDADGGERTVEVTPRADLAPPTVIDVEPARCDEMRALAPLEDPWRLAPYGAFLLLAIGLGVLGRRRGVRQVVIWGPFVVVYLLASVLGHLGGWVGCRVAGAGLRGQSVGLLLGELALTALAVGWFAFARRRGHVEGPEPPAPLLSTLRAYGLGVFYAATWMVRVGLLTIPLAWLSRQLEVGQVSPMLGELLGAGARDPVQAALIFGTAVILAPVAEEVLFRGIVLPHLARALSPWGAIVGSAVLFGLLHVAHGVLLVGPLTLGLVLGWARWRAGSLGPAILLHTTLNGFAMMMSLR